MCKYKAKFKTYNEACNNLNERFSKKIFIILGDLDQSTNEDDARRQRFEAIETFTHPNFDAYDRSSNIKLLKFNGSIKFDEYIRPACLSQPESEIPQKLMEIGWGDTNIRSNGRLHKVKMNHISDENCKKVWTHEGLGKYFTDSGSIFCAETIKDDRHMCAVSGKYNFKKNSIK